MREKGISRSNQPKLVGLVLALRDTPLGKPMFYLCDNQMLLMIVKRWVGEGGKEALAGAPDALREAFELLRERIETGAATFLIKMKAHWGESANEGAGIQVDKAISEESVPIERCERTSRAVFTWK